MINSFKGSYRFLSNFYPIQVALDGVLYKSVEHAYQAAKNKDFKYRLKLYYAVTPGEAKRIGSRAKLRPDWEQIKILVMKDLVFQKFKNEELKIKLLQTGNEELIEGNTWGDKFWGICNGVGENNLGKILMEIRQFLK